MRIIRFFQVLFVLAILSAPVWTIDYDFDPTFAPHIDGFDIYDVVIQPDGKMLVAGDFSIVNGVARRYIARLNADGSTDTSFTSPFSVPSSGFGLAIGIKPLANGQLLVNGKFKVGSQYSTYARLNADGTIDPTMTLGTLSVEGNEFLRGIFEPLPDGKFLACAFHNGGDQFSLIYRLKADGTVDSGFNVNFAIGHCQGMKLQPDGKILMSGFLLNESGVQIKPIHRLNADGSRDVSYDPPIPAGSGYFYPLPNGKIITIMVASGGNSMKRLNADGTLDIDLPCSGTPLHAFSDGRVLMSNCKRWSGGETWDFSSVLSDGTFEDMAWTNFDGGVGGFREDTNGRLIAYGRIDYMDNNLVGDLVRLKLDTAPPKAKYDFDNDGKSDVAVFRPSDRTWYILQSTAGPRYLQWGISTDKPAASHLDGDGRTDIAILRDGIIHGYSDLNGYIYRPFNISNGKPVFADFDADDREDMVVRGLLNGNVRWMYRLYFGISSPPQVKSLVGEQITDTQVMGDYDGDRRDEIGYFRDGTWTIAQSVTGPAYSVQWGSPGDIPVPGDYDGDVKSDFAVFRPSTGTWWIYRSSAGLFVMQFGQNGDVPVPADYDGDGKVDIAVYRNGVWWQYLSATGTVAAPNWGVAGDLPIPAQSQ